MFLVTVILATLVGLSAAQCKSYTLLGRKWGIGLCSGGQIGPLATSTQAVCNTAGTGVETKTYGTIDCTGTATSTTPIPGATNVVCNGVECSATLEGYAGTTTCSGNPASVGKTFLEPACQSGSISFCDATGSAYVSWNYGTDLTCGSGSAGSTIYKIGTGLCIPGYTSGTSGKYASCTSTQPTATAPSGMGLQYTIYNGVNICGGGFLFQYQSKIDSSCQTLSKDKTFCGDNAMWDYTYPDSTCSNDMNVSSVFFYQLGCSTTLNEIFNSGNSSVFSATSTTIALSCLSGATPPPKFGFGGANSVLAEFFFDSACTTRIMGAYFKVDGMCSQDGAMTSNKGTCTATGGLMVDEYGTANCTGNTVNSTTFGSTCKEFPLPLIPGKKTYVKASGCGTTYTGTGFIDPALTPGLSGGPRQFYIGLVALSVVLARLMA